MSQNQLHKIMDEKLLAQLGKGHNIYLRSRANSGERVNHDKTNQN